MVGALGAFRFLPLLYRIAGASPWRSIVRFFRKYWSPTIRGLGSGLRRQPCAAHRGWRIVLLTARASTRLAIAIPATRRTGRPPRRAYRIVVARRRRMFESRLQPCLQPCSKETDRHDRRSFLFGLSLTELQSLLWSLLRTRSIANPFRLRLLVIVQNGSPEAVELPGIARRLSFRFWHRHRVTFLVLRIAVQPVVQPFEQLSHGCLLSFPKGPSGFLKQIPASAMKGRWLTSSALEEWKALPFLRSFHHSCRTGKSYC